MSESEDIRYDCLRVFARFERQFVYAVDKRWKECIAQHSLDKLHNLFGARFYFRCALQRDFDLRKRASKFFFSLRLDQQPLIKSSLS
jgi:hypothetical protein